MIQSDEIYHTLDWVWFSESLARESRLERTQGTAYDCLGNAG